MSDLVSFTMKLHHSVNRIEEIFMKNNVVRKTKKTLLCLLVFICSGLCSPLMAQEPLKTYRINVEKLALAEKIAISFHHALLSVDYDKGTLIAQLTEEEVEKLRVLHISVTEDIKWHKKVQSFQRQLQHKAKRNERSKLKKTGIPGYACYQTVEETLAFGKDVSVKYPKLATWVDIGDSWKKLDGQGGYDLMVLKITNKDIAGTKPKLFLNSGMHAREYAPVALTSDFAKYLLEGYNTDADIRWIVDYHEVHILFQTNPDGRKIAEKGLLQRKNAHQSSCPAKSQGVDLNRNFALYWNTTPDGSSGDACSDVYRGASAESEPETKAMSAYIRSIFPDVRGPNIKDAAPISAPGMHIDIHSFSQLVLWPYGHSKDVTGNDASFQALGKKLAWFNKYKPLQSVGLYPTDGTSDDVSYGELGVAALTFELGTDFFQQCSVYNETIKPKNLSALLYAAKAVSAPYLLPYGPEVTAILLNNAEASSSVPAGSIIDLKVTADMSRTQQPSAGQSISKVEYSLDTPIWLAKAKVITLEQHDGDLSSVSETFSGKVATNELSKGQHTLYVRAYSKDNKQGVVSAKFINIGTNNSPVANFTHKCKHLACDFDASTSSDSDGKIVKYQWDFGAGKSALGKTATHTFASAGAKKVSLTVLDDANNKTEKLTEFSVTAAATPTPAPTPAPTPKTPVKPETSSGGLNWVSLFLLLLCYMGNAYRRDYHSQ